MRHFPSYYFCLGMAAVLAGFGNFSPRANAAAPASETEGAARSSSGFWRAHVEPVFTKHCMKCHGGVKRKGGLDLRSPDSVLRGGESGPAIFPGQPGTSLLFKAIQPDADPHIHMPPEEGKQLSAAEIALVRRWIELPREGGGKAEVSSEKALDSGESSRLAGEQGERGTWTPPDGLPVHRIIDRYIEMRLSAEGVSSAPVADSSAFVRRIYLDLIGRVPTMAERTRFLEDKEPRKRARLVDQLLAGDEYPRHLREIFDVVLMERRPESVLAQRRANQWHGFLEGVFRENRPWNDAVREMVLARPDHPSKKGAVWFLYERKNQHQTMAEAVAPVAFGMQVKCAQCHNHPLAPEIEQRHYWGLVAAFNRSKNVEAAEGLGVAESAVGGFVNFTNLEKESQPAVLALVNGKVIPEERPAADAKEEDAPEKYFVPPPAEKQKPIVPATPKFSRREKLAEAISRENPLLARAFVNRIWALLMGRGLVHPVDEMDSKHPPSHPELLDWLARDFERHGFDIKRLIREVALSRTYQLAPPGPGAPLTPPELFGRALEKPLTGEALYRSMLTATEAKADAEGKWAGRNEGEIRELFASHFPDLFAEEYRTSLDQALFLSNHPLMAELVKARPGNLTDRLMKLADAKDQIAGAFEAVYGRAPDAEELTQGAAYLERRAGTDGLEQLLWALLTSAEFQMNH